MICHVFFMRTDGFNAYSYAKLSFFAKLAKFYCVKVPFFYIFCAICYKKALFACLAQYAGSLDFL